MQRYSLEMSENLMREWGRWMWQDSTARKLRGNSMYSCLVAGCGGRGRALISDEDALRVCGEMVQLKEFCFESYRVCELYYQHGYSMVGVADKLGIGRNVVSGHLDSARFFIMRGMWEFRASDKNNKKMVA
ncbi:antiterminator Q family protein [Teredinibacter turnerae]|uniref:antiterminator Q family protein n=1 Tax=Teredinibacter turnerae TaxID=2426 RepID=UPI0030CF454C